MAGPRDIIPIPTGINAGLSSAKRSTLLAALGMPRSKLDDKCRGITNPRMKQLIVTEDVGPFKVTGLRPAVDSLRRVLAELRQAHPDVYAVIGVAGMLCVQNIKGTVRPSSHAWGSAFDFNIEGALDGINVGGGTGRRDDRTLAGLAAMAPFFHAEGWFWGVGFSTFEDGMHFEVADQTIRRWHADGVFGHLRSMPPESLSVGDEGAEVRRLQEALIARDFDLIPDGHFGLITQAMVMEFQAESGLRADGTVGPETKEALGLT